MKAVLLLFCAFTATVEASPIRQVFVWFDGIVTQSDMGEYPVGKDWHGYTQWAMPDEIFKARTFEGKYDSNGGCPLVCFQGYFPGTYYPFSYISFKVEVESGVFKEGSTLHIPSFDEDDENDPRSSLFFDHRSFAFAYWNPGSPTKSSPDGSYSGIIHSTRIIFEPEPGTGLLIGMALVLGLRIRFSSASAQNRHS